MVNVILKRCDYLNDKERLEIADVFTHSFNVDGDIDKCLNHYFSNIRSVLLAIDNGKIVAFHFYQTKVIDGIKVHHFSLSGKLPNLPKGIQSKFGMYILKRNMYKLLMPTPVYVAGVANSPKSYNNLYKLRGICFPDVQQQKQINPFLNLYQNIASALNMHGIDDRGILPNRMQALGFKLIFAQSVGNNSSKLHKDYIDYVRDYDNGMFTLVKVRPWIDVPCYIFRVIKSKIIS
ncbi:MAG: hypothetical protein RLZZ210_391 [Pseudomonadota bacterium]|jgi:hypothetical protein